MADYAEDALNARAMAQVFFKADADGVLRASSQHTRGSPVWTLINRIDRGGSSGWYGRGVPQSGRSANRL